VNGSHPVYQRRIKYVSAAVVDILCTIYVRNWQKWVLYVPSRVASILKCYFSELTIYFEEDVAPKSDSLAMAKHISRAARRWNKTAAEVEEQHFSKTPTARARTSFNIYTTPFICVLTYLKSTLHSDKMFKI